MAENMKEILAQIASVQAQYAELLQHIDVPTLKAERETLVKRVAEIDAILKPLKQSVSKTGVHTPAAYHTDISTSNGNLVVTTNRLSDGIVHSATFPLSEIKSAYAVGNAVKKRFFPEDDAPGYAGNLGNRIAELLGMHRFAD
jgi:hypothetical protein